MSNAGSNRSWVLPTGSPRSDGGTLWVGGRSMRRGYQVDRALTVLDQWMEDAALLELGDKLTESRPKTGAGERRVHLGPQTSALLRAHRKPRFWSGRSRARLGRTTPRSSAGRTACRGGPTRVQAVLGAGCSGRPATHQAPLSPALRDLRDGYRRRGPGPAQAAAGHSDDEVHDRYTHFWDDALRDAASQAEGYTIGDGTT